MNIKNPVIAAAIFISTACATGNGMSIAAEGTALTYKVDAAHTRVLWEAVTGSGIFLGLFNGASGEVVFNQSNPDKSSVSIVIEMDKLMTGVDRLDTHLKSDEFFDAEQFPEITFQSTKIEITGEKTAAIAGDLTFHGITKPVVLDAVFRNHFDLGESERVAFGATTIIKRSDFGVTNMDDWIEDDVKIRIELETGRSKEAANSDHE